MVFKMRPAVTPGARASAAALSDAKKRVAAAKDEAARAIALADAADACARLGRTNSAVGFYLRALRADPRSEVIVQRAMTGLERRPSALENLMWRHLGSTAHEWDADHRPAQIAGLKALAKAYGKRRRHHVRAQAIAHLLRALGASPDPKSAD